MSSTSNRDHPHPSAPSSTSANYSAHPWGIPLPRMSANVFESTSAAWEEPPLRQPQPSFVDNRLDRLGVLENMQPLGTAPTAKQRARARADPLRRHLGQKNLETLGYEDGRATPDFTNLSDASRAASRTSMRADDQSVPLETPPPRHTATTPPPPSSVVSSPAPVPELPQDFAQEHSTEAQRRTRSQRLLKPPTPPTHSAQPAKAPSLPQAIVSSYPAHPSPAPSPQVSPVAHSSTAANPSPIQAPSAFSTPLSLTMHSFGRVVQTTTHIQPGSPFAKAIVESKRRGVHGQVNALTYLHAASQKDSELATLLLGESRGDLTPLMRKRLKRKIKDLKRAFKRSEPIPGTSGTSSSSLTSSYTAGLHTSRSLSISQSPNKSAAALPLLAHSQASSSHNGIPLSNHVNSAVTTSSHAPFALDSSLLPQRNDSLILDNSVQLDQAAQTQMGSPIKQIGKGSVTPTVELEGWNAQGSTFDAAAALPEQDAPLSRRGSSPLSPPPPSPPDQNMEGDAETRPSAFDM